MSDVCENHPDREGFLAIDLPSIRLKRFWCLECRLEYDAQFPSKGFGRAYGSGTGPQAAAEQRESKDMQDEFSRGMKTSDERRYL